MSRSGGHWSKPAAWRTLSALMELGGSGTTWDIAEITGGLAVHQDIYSLRCWLQFQCDYDEDDTHSAVKTIRDGTNDNGRKIVRYELREDVRDLHRELRSTDNPEMGLDQDCFQEDRSTSNTSESPQTQLFDTNSTAAQRRAAATH